ncbi:hypothetical protein E5K00_08445 [Hymenobacter aquaticus]|uniref:Uncharacterized protein n=1 Tax=Hymenobacter aquaticus TaxID=1867101 RepID=A0A4Z0Q576_9BACT|nr:RES domain-containing protein [Hymenobacter aquaticus]TGE25210.1 hypothetical protein E5K00_08445 [Hymenobacter aquaticus]
MTVEELLKNYIFDLPKDWRDSNDGDYYHFVLHTLNAYVALLKKLGPIVIDHRTEYIGPLGTLPNTELVQKAVHEVRLGIIRALQALANQGSPGNALAIMAKHFDLPRRKQLYSPAVHLSRVFLSGNTLLYRLRKDDMPLQARQMLHIPYELRSLVTSQRFSIAGQPCIYAASSVYLAYKEIRATSYGLSLHAVKLRANVESDYAPVTLVDLRNRVQGVRKKYLGRPNYYDGDLIKFLVTWPLVMATSVPKNPKDNFHAEYQIPHLFLEWVRSSQPKNSPRLDGLMFSSSLESPSDPNYLNAYNVVIPVHHWDDEGLCRVRTSQLQVSSPITRAMLTVETSASTPPEEIADLVQQALQHQEFQTLSPKSPYAVVA